MSINHLICLAVILLLSISANRSLALDQDTRLQIGSTERRELCDSFAELIVEAHDKLSAGMTLERYKKE